MKIIVTNFTVCNFGVPITVFFIALGSICLILLRQMLWPQYLNEPDSFVHLNPISMVDIPIDDKDALDVMVVDGVSRCHGHIVEHAEAVSLVGFGVVA